MSAFTEEKALWLYQHYRWLDRHLPHRESEFGGAFILPTKQFFPHPYHHNHEGAVTVFECVRTIMGMSAWPCRLEQRGAPGQSMQGALARSGILGETTSNDPAGTFAMSKEREVVISYSVSMLKDPVGLVGTLAHELCHYLLATVQGEPPAKWEALEPLTDLAAVREGFGVILSNSAFQFDQWTTHDQQGWSARRKGYLSEAELGFSTAIYSVRNQLDPKIAARALKPNPREVFCDALDYIADLEAEHGASGE